MRWLLFILLPFSLFSQETYDNCQNVPIQNYQVEYDVNKEYFWYISDGAINLDNTFSDPNGDNVNEVYEIKGRSVANIEYMSVYNRWGQKIIESNSNILWDGSNCQIGVYTINVFVDNNRYVRNVTLIK